MKGNRRKKIEWDENTNGCWECTSHGKNNGGYPRFHWDGATSLMSRFIWEQCFGEIPKDKIICHKCDNPACIRIDHLFLGTHQTNADDCKNKGRRPKGENHGMAKLTKREVDEIRTDNRIHEDIARSYNVNRRTIDNIVNRKSYI